MNNKAQSEVGAGIMAVLGAGLAWYMAGNMGVGFFTKMITTLITGVAGYFLAYTILES